MIGVGDSNATFCATVVDQWVRRGLKTAFIAPGSRSTPLALAFAADDRVRTEVFLDERSASFAALGHGLASSVPAAVVCTSGTAATHLHAAVVEADLSAVPMLVCTADRPPELLGRGAPQTIDQAELFGGAVRRFIAAAPPDEVPSVEWRPMADKAWAAALGTTPGPVHLNIGFREPLIGTRSALPPLLTTERRASTDNSPDPDLVSEVVGSCATRRGVIVAGRGETAAASIATLADRLGWPIIADHRSGCRRPGDTNVIERYDSLLRDADFGAAHRPEVVVRLGEIVSSKAVSLWLADLDADVFAGRPHGRFIDPEAIADVGFDERGFIDAVLTEIDRTGQRSDVAAESSWLGSWREADDLAIGAIDRVLGDGRIGDEVTIARTALQAVPRGGALVVASSMPVRDVEWFGPSRDDISVFSNRGANGIDGTIATAIGVALDGRPTVCLVGDVAMLHDATSLTGLSNRTVDLTVVVIDNDGGGIFSFLPQRDQLDHSTYEQLFGTPHGTDAAALVRAHGVPVETWPATLAPNGIRFVIASSNRDENRSLHDRLHQAVADALTSRHP